MTVALQAPRQEQWSELPFPTPGHFPDPRIEPTSLLSLALEGGFLTTSASWVASFTYILDFTPLPLASDLFSDGFL